MTNDDAPEFPPLVRVRVGDEERDYVPVESGATLVVVATLMGAAVLLGVLIGGAVF